MIHLDFVGAQHGSPLFAVIPNAVVQFANGGESFMPGRRPADKECAFLAIISTMLGALAIARILPDPAQRAKLLANTRDFLFRSF